MDDPHSKQILDDLQAIALEVATRHNFGRARREYVASYLRTIGASETEIRAIVARADLDGANEAALEAWAGRQLEERRRVEKW